MDPPATAPAVPTASDGDSNSGDGEEKEDAVEEEEEQTLLFDHVPGTSTRPAGNAGRNSLMVMANLLDSLSSSTTMGAVATLTPQQGRRRSMAQGRSRRTTLGLLPTLARGGAPVPRGRRPSALGNAPRAYRPELGLSSAAKRSRERLAARYATLGFPMDGCMQVLKESSGDLDKMAKLLLFYYQKGEGVRNMVKSLTLLIKRTEEKLKEALAAIKTTMSDGPPAERYIAVRKHFDACDTGGKLYLTSTEFHKLSATLGVEMSAEELEEAILEIDDDGNGAVDLDEYLMWWGDDELLTLYRRRASAAVVDIVGAGIAANGAAGGGSSSSSSSSSPSMRAGIIPPLQLQSAGIAEGDEEEEGEEEGGEGGGADEFAKIDKDAPSWMHTLNSGLTSTPPGDLKSGGARSAIRRRTQSASEWVSYSKMHLGKQTLKEDLPDIRSIEKKIKSMRAAPTDPAGAPGGSQELGRTTI